MAIPLSEVPHLDAGGALSLTKSTSIIQGIFPLFIHQLPCYTAVIFSTLTPTLNSPPRVSIIIMHEASK